MKDKEKTPKDGGEEGSEVWLKHTGTSTVLNYAVGELPGGAVFKCTKEQALSMPADMFRPATLDEVDEQHLVDALQNVGPAAAPDGSKKSRRK